MNRSLATRVSALALALSCLAGCSTDGRPSVPEDSPQFTCYIDGNRICGPTATDEAIAWEAWDKADGPRKLRMDPARAFKVAYVGSATMYPKLDEYDLALPAVDGKWYVFRAEYTD